MLGFNRKVDWKPMQYEKVRFGTVVGFLRLRQVNVIDEQTAMMQAGMHMPMRELGLIEQVIEHAKSPMFLFKSATCPALTPAISNTKKKGER